MEQETMGSQVKIALKPSVLPPPSMQPRTIVITPLQRKSMTRMSFKQ